MNPSLQKSDVREYMLYDSIYIMYRTRPDEFTVFKVKIVVTLGGWVIIRSGHKGASL